MPDSQQQQTIKSGPRKVGRPLGSVPRNKLPSLLPEMAGKQFGRLRVISGEIVRKKERGRPHILVECVGCSAKSLRDYTSLMNGTAGCRKCGNPRQAPKWLVSRAISAKQRCTNQNAPAFERYGARGIRFLFSSPTAMAVWVQENLGLHPDMEIDRINNDGHYEAGNLRWSTRSENQCNTRGIRSTAMMHKFRKDYPGIKYSDATICRLFAEGKTADEIVDRYSRQSCKPKGVYGTYSIPDPYIASLSKDC